MDEATFKDTIARLERKSAAAPRTYQLEVAGLAALGFLVLGALIGTVGLGILLLVALGVAIVLSGGTVLLFVLKLGKLLVLIAVPMWFLVKASVQALFTRLPAPTGERVTRDHAPALFAALDRMRRTMRGPRFHHVLVIGELNAAVVQRPLFGLFGPPRNHLLLGLPLLEALPADEALAVVAHEYGHLAGSHSRFAAWIYRLRNTWGTIQAFTEQLQGWLPKLVQPLVRWYAPHFNAYTFVLARANEYQADAASAELVGAEAASRALKRVELIGPRFEQHLRTAFEAVRDTRLPPSDFSERWASSLGVPDDPQASQGCLARALDRPGHFADTHPSLRARLTALRALAPQVAEVASVPAASAGPSAATAWLGSALPELRRAVSKSWSNEVAAGWIARHDQLQRDLQTRAALLAKAERDRNEEFELLRLDTELEVGKDQRAAWAAFNALHPDHAAGLYFEGAERLHWDDAAGVDLLTRAIVLDAELTKPACERLHAYYGKHDDHARAAAIVAQWQDRETFEQRRAAELQTFDPRHELVTAEPEVREQMRVALSAAMPESVTEVWLVRRRLPSDQDVRTYLVAIRLSRWAGFTSKGAAVVERLVALPVPVHVFYCVLEGDLAKLSKRLVGIPDSRLV